MAETESPEPPVENWVETVGAQSDDDDDDEGSNDRPPFRQISGLRYRGTSDTRTLTAADVSSLGGEPKTQEPLVWGRANSKTIDVSEINAKTLDALLATGEFEVVPA